MRIIITGSSGFIGKHLLGEVRSIYGEDAVAFSSKEDIGAHITYKKRPGFGLGAAELAFVQSADVLIHAGAFTPKKAADADLLIPCTENISFTENLLSLPWKNLKKIIFLSTIDVYAESDDKICERTPTIPQSLYGMSKLYCEKMVNQYCTDRGIASQTLRVGHVYGPGEERYAKVIPNSIQRIVAGKSLELWGDGSELRSYIYVKDVVAAIVKSIGLKDSPGVINLVSGNKIKVKDLLGLLVDIGGKNNEIALRNQLINGRDWVFDNSKLKKYLIDEETDLRVGLLEEFKYIESLR